MNPREFVNGIRERFAAGWKRLTTRVDKWINAGRSSGNKGILDHEPLPEIEEQRYMWLVGPTEHCDDCRNLNGSVLTGPEWRELGIYPQSRDLECRGFNCQCILEETDQRSHGVATVATRLGVRV